LLFQQQKQRGGGGGCGIITQSWVAQQIKTAT